MSALVKQRTVLKQNILIREDQGKDLRMYEAMYSPLIEILKKHGAILDVTSDSRCVIIMKATSKCRKKIRRLYGSEVQKQRIGTTLQLRGFCNE